MRAQHLSGHSNQSHVFQNCAYNGGESMVLAIIAFGTTIWESHPPRHNDALSLVLLTIIVFCIGMVWLWRYEKNRKP
jgi:hypothetical protein